MTEENILLEEKKISLDSKGSLDEDPRWKKSHSSGSNTTEDENKFDDELNKSGRSSTIYSRGSDERACLEDFRILKTLGVGSFGKVFLVEHKEFKTMYAMKTIRKDKIIDYE